MLFFLGFQLSLVSGIAIENLEMAKSGADFPYQKLSVRDIHSDHTWCSGETEEKIDEYPLRLKNSCLLIFR